jgi:hypothetical protein
VHKALVVWVHQIHTTGGANGSVTMLVMVFPRFLVLFVWSCKS